MSERYSRNCNALSPADTDRLHAAKICVIGCGGLGGYIIEAMARLGVLHITAVDCDVFDESNLNRQLLCTESVIGRRKAEVAKERVAAVNSEVHLNAICERFDETNAEGILAGHGLALDALDNIPARLLLADACGRLGIPLVHGSIGGWYGQVMSVFPGDSSLQMLYGNATGKGVEKNLGNLPYTAQTVASLQCAEAVKILTGRGEPLRNELLRIDLLNNSFDIIKLA